MNVHVHVHYNTHTCTCTCTYTCTHVQVCTYVHYNTHTVNHMLGKHAKRLPLGQEADLTPANYTVHIEIQEREKN